MHDAPLFLGLTRPPKIFGLPIGYFVSLTLGSVIPFVAANDWRFLLIGVVGSLVGTVLGRALGLYGEGDAAGFIMSVVGAIALLAIVI